MLSNLIPVFQKEIQEVVDRAKLAGYDVRVYQTPLQPLRMGNHETVVEVYPAHVRYRGNDAK